MFKLYSTVPHGPQCIFLVSLFLPPSRLPPPPPFPPTYTQCAILSFSVLCRVLSLPLIFLRIFLRPAVSGPKLCDYLTIHAVLVIWLLRTVSQFGHSQDLQCVWISSLTCLSVCESQFKLNVCTGFPPLPSLWTCCNMNNSVSESEPDPATTLQNPELFFLFLPGRMVLIYTIYWLYK